ncbi:MAG: right-handed parallel beta-helix repeat-containing protein [Phycisphaerae bacterium]
MKRTIAILVLLLSAGPARSETWNVTQFSHLVNALYNAQAGDEVVIAPGQYHVTTNLYWTRRDVTIRGATGKAADVVLYGNGMNNKSGVLEGFWAAADGVQLRDLTIRDFYYHGVHISGEGAGDLADNVVLSNLRVQNCGERYVKLGQGPDMSENVLIEDSYFLQTEPYAPRPGHPVSETDYIGGIDAMENENWIIRNNRFEGIKGATGSGAGAIFLWNTSLNPLIDSNVIVDCGEGINLGNADNYKGTWHVTGATVRNNMLVQANSNSRLLQLSYTRDVRVVNNTLFSDGAYGGLVHVLDSAGIETEDLKLINNLIRGGFIDQSIGEYMLLNNLVGSEVRADWFIDPASGDLHLLDSAGMAIGQAIPLADVLYDIDGQLRGCDPWPDLGADEVAAIPEPMVLPTVLAGGWVVFRRRRRCG